MPIVISPTSIITKEELEVIMRANAIEMREKKREHAKATGKFIYGFYDIDKK